nr:putative disease resistance protein RGA3 [Quercus suber]
MGRLRTVFLNWVDLGDKLLEFKCVRGLSLSGKCIKELPESIGMLRHLRLLRIKGTYIKVIPNSVCMLYNLQTLVIKGCCFLKELPKDLRNLINLRHIDIDNYDSICGRMKLPTDIGRLTCLQTLPFFGVGQDIGSQIGELGCLSQLRGELSIYNLGHVKDKEEAKTANLAEKPKVHKLEFFWSWWDEREGNNNDEDVLEGFQPHPNLKSLEIKYFKGEKFPSWLLGSDNIRGGLLLFDHLLEIRLSYCSKCEKLPTLGHLPSLKVLGIAEMYNVRCIGTEFYGSSNGEGSSNSRGGSGSTVLFPALEKLVLGHMRNLEEWNDVTEPTAELGMIFPRLERLQVWGCEKLTSAPHHFPSLKKLFISGIRGPAFEQIISELTTLTSLEIWEISELACLPEHFLQKNRSLMDLRIWNCADLKSILPRGHEWPICTSLRSLHIFRCDELRTLPRALCNLHCLEDIHVEACLNLSSFPSIKDMRELPSLTDLEIRDCQKWTRVPDGLDCLTRLKRLLIGGFFKELNSFPGLDFIQRSHAPVEKLYLYGWASLNSLPEEIQYFTAVKILDISEFGEMDSLPDWLGNLSSLQELHIHNCKKLMYLPTTQAMRRLIKLRIWACPKLKERCAEGSGAEWSKIAHIPEFSSRDL